MSSRFLNISRRNQPSSRSPSPQGRGAAAAEALAARVERFTLSLEGDATARSGDDEDNQSFTTADGGGAGEVEGESLSVTCFMFGDASPRGGGSSVVELDMGSGGVIRRDIKSIKATSMVERLDNSGFG